MDCSAGIYVSQSGGYGNSTASSVWFFALGSRDAYRPIMFSPKEVLLSPDCEDSAEDEELGTIRTPTGIYDVGCITNGLPASQMPELAIVKADATRRNLPVNLKRLACPKLLILGNTQHLGRPIQTLIQYALQEEFEFILSDHKRHHLHFFREAGFENVCWLPGLNIWPHEGLTCEDKRYDVSFVGQIGKWHPYRRYILNHLKQNDVPLSLFHAPQREAAQIYAKSHINLNISLNGDLNLRVFEVLSSGGFLITDKLSCESGLEMLFKDGEHLVQFSNEKDLIDKVNYFLRHPDEEREIAQNGYEEYQRNHTPEKKIQELMGFVSGGVINPIYKATQDKRSRYVRSSDSETLMKRVAIYEFCQELHLNEVGLSIVIWPRVNARIVCDLIDLPRLNITMCGQEGEMPDNGLRLLQITGAAERLCFSDQTTICQRGIEWDAVVLTYSEFRKIGVEDILNQMRFRWLVITEVDGGLDIRDREMMKQALVEAGFGESEAFSEADDGRLIFSKTVQAQKGMRRGTMEFQERFENQEQKRRLESPEALYLEVRRLMDNGNRREAIGGLRMLLSLHPDYALAHNDLGVLYYNEGDMEKALQHYEHAARLEPENAVFQKNLADFYCVESGKLEEGLKIYVKVLEANPTDIETLLTIGDICASLGKMEDAKVFFNRILELEPWNLDAQGKLDAIEQKETSPQLNTLKGPSSTEHGVRWSEDMSQESEERGLRTEDRRWGAEGHGESPEEAYEHIQELVNDGRQAEAIRGLENLVERYPGFALGHNDLGVLYFKDGEKERAFQHYEQATRLEPENATFQKNLADFYCIEMGDLEQGLKIYLKVLEANPTDIETLTILGDICASLEKREDARIFYDRVLELEPWNTDAMGKLDRASATNHG